MKREILPATVPVGDFVVVGYRATRHAPTSAPCIAVGTGLYGELCWHVYVPQIFSRGPQCTLESGRIAETVLARAASFYNASQVTP